MITWKNYVKRTQKRKRNEKQSMIGFSYNTNGKAVICSFFVIDLEIKPALYQQILLTKKVDRPV